MIATTRAQRSCAVVLLLLLLLALLPRPALASRPVIVPGREAEIEALFLPHRLGEEVADGWTLHSFAIDQGTIEITLVDGAEPPRTARMSLDHPDYGPRGARILPGFAVTVLEEPPGSAVAIEALSTAIASNDDGAFWQTKVARADEQVEVSRGSLRTQLLRWALDGVLLLGLFTIVLLALVFHLLPPSRRGRSAGLLAAIVLLGAGLRLWLSPAVALAPWPYTRLLPSAALLYESPLLALTHPEPLWLSETTLTSTLLLAVLAPLAVYAHARLLLEDHRAALIAAGLVAVLPLHLRFSHADVAFIPSITISSTLFALMHTACRDPERRWGWVAVALLAGPLVMVYAVRPLNIIYCPLLLALPWIDQGLLADKRAFAGRRVVVALLLVALVTAAIGVPNLLRDFAPQVSEGSSLETLRAAAGVLFSPRMNALLNPSFTPPGFMILALIGIVDLWRRRRRRLLGFLLTWLLLFLVAHAYVVPVEPYMQARYHLHLVIPHILLVVCGVDAVLRRLLAPPAWTWWRPIHGKLTMAALLLYALAVPVLHRTFITNVDFNDQREWSFVHGLRQEIPEQCTILEYVGHGNDSRFDRVGAHSLEGRSRPRWTIVEIPAGEPGQPPLSAEVLALLEQAPACLYWYEGLPCWGDKPEGEYQAPACKAISGYLELEAVATTTFPSRLYDENLARGLEQGQPVHLTLHRARGHR